jgi:hypothetical protein
MKQLSFSRFYVLTPRAASQSSTSGDYAMPKTKAEKFELYRDVDIKGSTAFAPAAVLEPNTEIDVLDDVTNYFDKKSTYIYVEVMDGAHRGKFGFLPKFSILACDVLEARAGLSRVSTTGVKYGGSGTPKGDTGQTGFTVRGHDLDFQLPFQGKEGCSYCGSTIDTHTIEESSEVKELAQAVHASIANWAKRPAQTMIGVLRAVSTRNSTIMAVSGFNKDFEADLEREASRLRMKFVTSDEAKDWGYLRDFSGKTITEVGSEKINIKNMYQEFLICAGPKLLQCLLHSYQTEEIKFKGKLFMSEIWYKPSDTHQNYGNAATAESCPKCAILIPRMLCGYKPSK